MKAITEESKKKILLDSIGNILDAADLADDVELTIKIKKNSVPFISYKIKGFPMMRVPINRIGDDI